MRTQAMHNLGCTYELQQRFELGKKWFEIAISLNDEKFDWRDQT